MSWGFAVVTTIGEYLVPMKEIKSACASAGTCNSRMWAVSVIPSTFVGWWFGSLVYTVYQMEPINAIGKIGFACRPAFHTSYTTYNCPVKRFPKMAVADVQDI